VVTSLYLSSRLFSSLRLAKVLDNQSIFISGQSAWLIRFKSSLCTVDESRNWGPFVDNIEWQRITREFCAALAQIFGSTRAIYYPDSMYQTSLIGDRLYENNSFDQIEEYALRDFGLPSAFLTPERAVWLEKLLVEKGKQAASPPPPTREEIFSGERMRVLREKLKQDRTHNVYFVDDFHDIK
jgi:hypothetical protein